MSEEEVTRCLGALRPPRGMAEWRTPKLPDGRELCKHYMKDSTSCFAGDGCKHAHVPKAERVVCWSWSTYGVCERGVNCWFPHPPASHVDADVALQCYVGYAERVVTRCREILRFADDGDAETCDPVVATARADMSKNALVVVLIRARGGKYKGAAGVLRALAAADVYLMAHVRRVYVLSAGVGTSVTTEGETPAQLAAPLEQGLRDVLTGARETAPGGTLLLRVRGFPRGVERGALDALAAMAASPASPRAEDGAMPLYELAPAAEATHVLDLVGVKGRIYVALWDATATAQEDNDTNTAGEYGAGVPDWGRTAPALPPRGSVTLMELCAYIDRVEEHRARRGVMCRAFFKLEEAVARGAVPIEAGWQCVDIGASPGGWTQFMSERLLELGGGGHVWGIDPGMLNWDAASFPNNVTHLAMRAEDAHEAIARDAAERGLPGPCVRLLVCDANMAPAAALGLLLSMKKFLARTGDAYLITTFKNFCKGRREWERQIEAAVATLEEAQFDNIQVFHTFSNCAQEKTVVARFNPITRC